MPTQPVPRDHHDGDGGAHSFDDEIKEVEREREREWCYPTLSECTACPLSESHCHVLMIRIRGEQSKCAASRARRQEVVEGLAQVPRGPILLQRHR